MTLAEPQPDAQYYAVVDVGDGVVAVGYVQQADGTIRAMLRGHAAADGATAWTYVDPIEEPESIDLGATLTADGDIVTVGWIRGVNAYRDLRIRRFSPDGTPIDTTIHAEPITSYYPRAAVVDASGDVIVCGQVVRASAANAIIGRFALGVAEPAQWLQRIEAVGPGSTDCEALVLDELGRVLIAGWAFHGKTGFDPVVARIDVDGEVLWSSRVVPHDGVYADFGEGLVADPDGNAIVVGSIQEGASSSRLWIGRVRG
jgi:hypothetical protein